MNTETNINYSPPQIGLNVREQRQRQKMSLGLLAQKSGVSKAMLSQIEGDKVNPTIATVWKIAGALSVDLNFLLRGKVERSRKFNVIRHDDLVCVTPREEGVKIQLLSPGSWSNHTELYLVTMSAGSSLYSNAHSAGTEELVNIISGKVKVIAGERQTLLNSGDNLSFDCDVEHTIENSFTEETKLFLAVRLAAD